jgi:acyl-coenzyme A thioesterase PaaI-like protein
MDITEVPFNKFLGIRRADGDPGHLLQLDDSPTYQNHLGTVHASVQLALAEASSGECLLQQFPDLAAGVLSVVRRMEAKFKNPLQGKIVSRATIRQQDAEKLAENLFTKGRGLIAVAVEVVDADGVIGLTSTIEWFVQRQSPQPS